VDEAVRKEDNLCFVVLFEEGLAERWYRCSDWNVLQKLLSKFPAFVKIQHEMKTVLVCLFIGIACTFASPCIVLPGEDN